MEKDQSQKIVQEYFMLVEKSQQLFAGLRDLPQFGRHWQPYFQKTFEIYTKLWKFQQQHRAVLENKEIYGLKRWEIGEIASKIGQLYYHYYLRTSETNYIEEAFIFYEAIRQRDYFKDVFETKNPLLVVKKLRYYARFIVVCLLLNRRTLVTALVEELQSLVDAYMKEFKPADAPAWRLVLQEITQFLQVDCPLVISDRSKDAPPISNRLKLPPSTVEGRPRLQEAILVGNYQNQVKFSELTLDMFRVMQVLERERVTMSRPVIEAEKKRSNPHKFLLYRPSFSQLMVFLSTAFKELHDNNVLLLYISADGMKREDSEHGGLLTSSTSGAASVSSSSPSMGSDNYQQQQQQKGKERNTTSSEADKKKASASRKRTTHRLGGVAMNSGGAPTMVASSSSFAPGLAATGNATNKSTSNVNVGRSSNNAASMTNNAPTAIGDDGREEGEENEHDTSVMALESPHCLYPEDILPFTRKKMFLIIESSNSFAFNSLPNLFGQPFLCLLSPASREYTVEVRGNLFTLFLHAPLTAFCFVVSKNSITQEVYDKCTKYIDSSFEDVQKLLCNFEGIPPAFHHFIEEDFLQSFILRFIFCHSVVYLHKNFRSKPGECRPQSHPSLPKSFLMHPVVLSIVYKLASFLNVSQQFSNPEEEEQQREETEGLYNLSDGAKQQQ